MASQVSQILASPQEVISSNMENRPKANSHPDIWGDMFLNCSVKDIDTTTKLQHEELKEEVRRMLVAPVDNSNQRLPLLNAVQRLAVSYHFEKEIEDALEAIYHDSNDVDENDLYTTALRFRLLRENGFHVSCDAFEKFKDEEGNFKSSVTSDVRGLLELYEASYLRVHGEDILDEAISFAITHLTLAAKTLDCPLSEQVAQALKQSIRRRLPRVEARQYISVYQDDKSHIKALLEFAKIDFNLLQLLHRKELSEICRWWKDPNFTRKLPFVRDRVVECYFWILGVFFEPQYSLARKMLTKVIAMASITDDIYDSYGTYDELILYIDAIERWDIQCLDQLPEYMKISYKALLDVYEEMEQLLAEGRQYRVEYAKKAMIRLAQAYCLETKWTHQNYKPTFEEFRANALTTSGYDMLAITAFVGMGDIVTPETFNWAANDPHPKIIRASMIICRFMDDIAEHKFKQREDECSAIECYMEQYGVPAQEAYDEFSKHIESAWKDINEALLKPTEMPVPVLNRSLNLARVMDVLFKDGDGYTHVGKATQRGITSLLIDPIPL